MLIFTQLCAVVLFCLLPIVGLLIAWLAYAKVKQFERSDVVSISFVILIFLPLTLIMLSPAVYDAILYERKHLLEGQLYQAVKRECGEEVSLLPSSFDYSNFNFGINNMSPEWSFESIGCNYNNELGDWMCSCPSPTPLSLTP